jgi:Fur family transcriptional regulator, zinc uptake regulator
VDISAERRGNALTEFEATLQAAARQCARNGARLTAQRRNVLALLLERANAVTAYDLLDALSARLKRRISPPTVYRALDFLVAQGVAAKVESRNAWVACRHVETPHDHLLLLCRQCGRTEEIHEPAIERALSAAAMRAGFASESRVIEITGLCSACGGG